MFVYAQIRNKSIFVSVFKQVLIALQHMTDKHKYIFTFYWNKNKLILLKSKL